MKYKIALLILVFTTCFCCVFASENLTIHSKAAIAMDADSSIVLYNKDINKKIYPASTTKILTAVLAIENLDLNRLIVVSKSAISIPWDSSSVYLKEGEIVSVKDLLYCLLLNSGNDAANVLAEAVSGDIPHFVTLMNIKAKEIGCTNTNFNNAHGYSDDNHYTTALDMAKIFNYCIQNETFVDIISAKSYVVEKTNKTNKERYLNNTNRLILQKEDSIYSRYYQYTIGGKTGYTDEAGRTLITFARKDGKTVIVAVFGASSGGREDVRYTDAITLFEYSFNNFSKTTIANAENYTFDYINTNKKLKYTLILKDNIEVLLNSNQNPSVSYTISVNDNALAPFDENGFKETSCGTIAFNLMFDDGTNYEIVKDLYLKNIEKYSVVTSSDIMHFILVTLVILFLVSITLIVLKQKVKHVASPNKSRKNRRIK